MWATWWTRRTHGAMTTASPTPWSPPRRCHPSVAAVGQILLNSGACCAGRPNWLLPPSRATKVALPPCRRCKQLALRRAPTPMGTARWISRALAFWWAAAWAASLVSVWAGGDGCCCAAALIATCFAAPTRRHAVRFRCRSLSPSFPAVFQDGVKALVEKGYKKITPFFIPYAITNMGERAALTRRALLGTLGTGVGGRAGGDSGCCRVQPLHGLCQSRHAVSSEVWVCMPQPLTAGYYCSL